ncbi:MAG: DNA methyltransferase, partial [Alphaproteobacteria bacterium]|nr:DNA methyltransferase [Alphaproteobacteria bacterium]
MSMAHIKIDETWSFSDKKRADTGYLTHDFHRYPAKFIPQIAGRLIETYSNQGDIVMDPFAGCGTTLVESKLNGRKSSGLDINPVATMITKAKTTPIHPDKLAKAFARLTKHIETYPNNYKTDIQHARLDF